MRNTTIRVDLRIALLYAIFGGLWIVLTDYLLQAYVSDVVTLTTYQTYKGWAFVLCSTLLIFFLLRHHLLLGQIAANKLQETERENELRFATIFHASPSAIAITRFDTHHLVDVNAAWQATTGYSHAEAIGHTPFELNLWIDPEQRQGLVDTLRVQGAARAEAQIRQKAGEIRDVLMSAELIEVEGVQCLLSMAQDITARKQAEEKIRESEETYRNLFHNAQVGLFRTRISDGKTLESNAQLARMFGYDDRETFIGEYVTSQNYVDPGTRERMLRELQENGTVQNFQARFYRRDGSNFWAQYSARIYPEKGWIEGVAEDITARKETEEALRESKALLDAAGQIARFGGWSINLAENIVTWSEQVAAIHEMPPDFFPSVEESIGFYAPEWRERITQVFSACAQKGQPYDEEMEIITARGNRVWVRTTGEAVRDETGAIVHVQGAFQDITARKQTAVQLAEQLDELRRWHAATLGREGRVMELKREVNALLAQTAQPPRYLSVVEDPDED